MMMNTAWHQLLNNADLATVTAELERGEAYLALARRNQGHPGDLGAVEELEEKVWVLRRRAEQLTAPMVAYCRRCDARTTRIEDECGLCGVRPNEY